MSFERLRQIRSFGIYMLFLPVLVVAVWCGIPPENAFAAASVPPSPGAIRAENRLAGTQDLVTVTGLSSGTVVKVYADVGSLTPLGSATVGSGLNSASVAVGQLGAAGGHIFVTVTEPAYSESRRIVKTFPAEAISVAPSASSIRVVNQNGGASDQVIVQKLQAGDTVKVYADTQKNQQLGSAAADDNSINGTVISVGQLGAADGVVYVTVTASGQRESTTTEKAYAGETKTPKPLLGQIRISNEYNGLSDHVVVSGLQQGDVLRIYASERAAASLTQATVASGADSADAVMPQLGTGEGVVYVTVTRPPLLESARVAKRFRQEPVTASPAPAMITVANEAEGTADHIEVHGLTAGDVVKVYDSPAANDALATATVAADSMNAVVTLPQLGSQAGYIYVTATSTSRGESRRVVKAYAAEFATQPPARADIRIHNAAGPNDTITVFGLQANDTVSLYEDEAATTPIGQATVAQGAVTAVVHTSLPGTGYGVVYVAVKRAQEEESPWVAKIYPAEPVSLPLSPNHIRINNMAGSVTGDELSVLELKAGDTIRLYSDEAATTPLQTLNGADAAATLGASESVLTINNLKLEQLGGRLYVTVTVQGKRESARTLKVYEAE